MTFTLPHGELTGLVRSNQKQLYSLLFFAASQALKKLCADPRHLGAQPGILGVLHTWQRDMGYHPHVHFLVPAGGVNLDGRWVSTRYPDYLVPVKALSPIFRAKFRDALREIGLYGRVPVDVWKKNWVVHCESAGQGPEVIRYLARYIYRVALTNSNILALRHDRVTFRYQPSGTKIWKTMTLPALSFMARFLQHVLPASFAKVRYYGFLHPRCTEKLQAIRSQLALPSPQPIAPLEPRPMLCPRCKVPLLFVEILPRLRAPP
jgi:hypothetical protein